MEFASDVEEEYETWIDKFMKYEDLEEVTREIVVELVNRIVVNEDKSVDV